jgi:hypothetical protein
MRASELEILTELRGGKLVQVLHDYELASNAAVWALYPSAKHLLPRMRALLDFLAVWFRQARDAEPAPATSGNGSARAEAMADRGRTRAHLRVS